MDAKAHWEKVYTTKAPDAVSWYRAHLETSLALIERAADAHSASIIDVGGGESTLVDDLFLRGYRKPHRTRRLADCNRSYEEPIRFGFGGCVLVNRRCPRNRAGTTCLRSVA